MIVVKIELHSAVTKKISEIGRMYIANDGTVKDKKKGNYDAYVCKKNNYKIPRELWERHLGGLGKKSPKAVRVGRVENYPRQSYNVWRLIKRALASCFPEEN